MKSLYLMALAILFSMSVFAQSLTGPTSVTTGGTVTLTGVGESTSGNGLPGYEFVGAQAIDNSKNVIISPSGGYYYFITATLVTANSWHQITHSPSAITVKFDLNSSTPVTVTVYIPMFVAQGGQNNIQLIPYTITVNPVSNSGSGGSTYFPRNGDFILDTVTGAQYMMWENTLRHIPTPQTLDGLFTWNNNWYNRYTSAQINAWHITRGPIFSTDSEILQNDATGIIYMREGSTIYRYPNPDVANTYHMNWNNVHHSTWSDGFYTEGTVIWY